MDFQTLLERLARTQKDLADADPIMQDMGKLLDETECVVMAATEMMGSDKPTPDERAQLRQAMHGFIQVYSPVQLEYDALLRDYDGRSSDGF